MKTFSNNLSSRSSNYTCDLTKLTNLQAFKLQTSTYHGKSLGNEILRRGIAASQFLHRLPLSVQYVCISNGRHSMSFTTW